MGEIKRYTPFIIGGIILIIALVVLCEHCERIVKPVISIQDTLTTQNNRANKQIIIIDSSVSKRNKQLLIDIKNRDLAYNKLKSEYNKAIRSAPDTCRSYIDTVYKESIRLDSTSKAVIKRQDSTIQDQRKIIDLKTLIIYNKDLLLGLKSDSLDLLVKENKKRFWRGYWKGFRHGTVAGVMADEGLRFGIKRVIP